MKRLGIILATALMALTFWGCNDEEKQVDIITETLGQPVEELQGAQVDEMNENELEGMEEAVIPEEPAADLTDDEYIPQVFASGRYVLQVGVSPSKAIAERLAKKIENKGFSAYISSVENPADLVGTFYRVRVGYFKSLTQARLFGHNILMPMNIAFWIDNKSNDAVGNPGKKAEVFEAEEEDELVEMNEEVTPPAPQVEPMATPEAPATPAATPTATEPVAPAPAAENSPAPEKAKTGDDWASDDDDWSKEDDWGK